VACTNSRHAMADKSSRKLSRDEVWWPENTAWLAKTKHILFCFIFLYYYFSVIVDLDIINHRIFHFFSIRGRQICFFQLKMFPGNSRYLITFVDLIDWWIAKLRMICPTRLDYVGYLADVLQKVETANPSWAYGFMSGFWRGPCCSSL
jgi:hypothetical protein